MNKLNFALLTLCLFSFQLWGQNGNSIFGTVYSHDGEALPYANVVLYNQADSSLAKADHSQNDGSFVIPAVRPGNYFLVVSFLGLPSQTVNGLVMEQGKAIDLENIILPQPGVDLAEIVVSTTKPLIEVRADKTIFNVEASVTAAGSDGFEVLRKAPGVVIDNNDNIQMRGKSGVLVYIGGKQSYLSSQELANLLRSLNASDIEAIEVITNPSARYDASGNAGIINIILKKEKGLGTNGTLNLNAALGLQYRTNGSLSFNHRSRNFNVYGSAGGGIMKMEHGLNIYRIQNNKVFDQQQFQVNNRYPVNTRLGMDYFLSEKHTVGVMGNLNTNLGSTVHDSYSRTLISNEDTPNQIDSILVATNYIDGSRLNANLNANYRFYDGTKGREFTFDFDKGYFSSTNQSIQPNTYYGPDENTILSERKFKTEAPSIINILSFKSDYEQRLWWPQAKITTGLKWTRVNTDNVFDFYNFNGQDTPIRDPEQSNHFNYDETVSAAYANIVTPLYKNIQLQAGLRAEHTQSVGDLKRDPGQEVKEEDYVEREYTDFFPSAALTWQLHPKHALNATYSRRINRPSYQHLNPFEWRLDELSYRKGSPFLTPQYSDAYELKYIAFQMVNLSVGYTRTTDLITDIVEPSQDHPDKSFINYRNLASQDHFSIGVSSPTPIQPWWNGYFNVSLYKSYFTADFPEYSFTLEAPLAFNVYAEQNFRVRQGTTIEVSGWYNSGSVWGGSWVTSPNGSLDVGVQQRLFSNKATLKLSFTDILQTARWSSVGESVPGMKVNANGYWDSRQVRLNFSYRFGNMDVKSSRQRRSGIDAETRRAAGE